MFVTYTNYITRSLSKREPCLSPMKRFLAARLLFLAVAISGFAFAAEPNLDRADDLVVFGDTRRVSIGMHRDQVLTWMQGQPDEVFQHDMWIYWDFHWSESPRYKNYTALVIIFVADRVKLIRLAEPEVTKALLIRFRAAGEKKVAAR